MNTALLIIDVQKAFIGELKDTKVYQETLMIINATADLFRKANRPVLIIKDLSEGEGPEYDVVDELEKNNQDIQVSKLQSNAFWDTDLESKLKALSVDFLVLCGNAAEYCVLATYNGAIERGFKTVMLQHGIFANHERGLLDLYWNRPLISYTAITIIINYIRI